MSHNYQVHTFGCKVNTYDSGLLEKNLAQSAANNHQHGKVHVINSCAVTQEATKEAVKLARRIKAKDPFAVVVATGCAAQVDADILESSPAIDLIVANSHKGQLPSLIDLYFKRQLDQKVWRSNIFKKDDLEAGGGLDPHHRRAFLKIQDGCNSFCSFCIIPYARGKSRSIPVLELVSRVNELVTQGIQEVVLTGVHIGDYEDTQLGVVKKLEDLIEALIKSTKVRRIRITSLEPIEISERLLEQFTDPRLCPHFHMSIQSASDQVLKGMKRNYGEREVRSSLEWINTQVPGAFVGMDVIAGFPTETEEFFLQTYKALSETPWTRLHVFPYSERRGTRAATFEQIPHMVRKSRAQRLRELSLERYQSRAKSQIGKVKSALILGGPERIQGLTSDYWSCVFEPNSHVDLVSYLNQEVAVEITDFIPSHSARMEGVLKAKVTGLTTHQPKGAECPL